MRSSPALPCSEPLGEQVETAVPARIASLDGIRAVSFLLVFVSHIGWDKILLHFGRRSILTADFGVTIFFFLSGFLITTLLRSEFEKNGCVNVRHFWLRRSLRIIPPLYLVMIAATLLALVVYPPGTSNAASVAARLLFYANYWIAFVDLTGPPGTTVVWSLAVEEHFYLLFPWLYIAMQKCRLSRPAQAYLLWGLCALVLAWRCVLFMGPPVNRAHILFGTDCRMDAILFGCALAVFNNPVLDPLRGSPRIWKYRLLPSAVAVLLLCLAINRADFKTTVYFSLQGVALTVVFVCAIRFSTLPVFRFLNWRPVAYVGALSYSLYLTHEVVLQAVRALLPQWRGLWHVLLTLVVSLIVSWSIYAFIELPCARLRRQLTG
jgi:peptidoglycan/LPS O-acetylase OafA/YrhL